MKIKVEETIALENRCFADPTALTYSSSMYESVDSKAVRAGSLENKIFP